MPDLKNIRYRLQPWGYLHISGNLFYDFRRLKKCNLHPRLFIIGAQKCGTSSLHQYLDEHPDVFMSKPLKEPGFYVPWPIIQSYYKQKNVHFYSRNDLLRRGMLRGYNDEAWIGESSTFYSNGTYAITESELNQDGLLLKDVRIIYLIRNPFDRIKSHFLHACRNNGFVGDINQFVNVNPEALGISQYGRQIAQYYKFINSEQILILQFEALVKSPQMIMGKVYKFLNLSPRVHVNFKIFNAAPETQNPIRRDIQFNEMSVEKINDMMQVDRPLLERFIDISTIIWRH
jgi:hypothetical protein